MILLAEDDPAVSSLFAHALEKHGYAVFPAKNGQEALELFQVYIFDIIFMDLEMPILGGIEAIRIIREQEDLLGEHTPIFALTACAESEYQKRCLEAGMDGHLSKPVNFPQLLRIIEDMTPRAILGTKIRQRARENGALGSSHSVDPLLYLFRGNRESARAFLELLLEEYPKHIDSMHKAISKNDRMSLARTLHDLKGSMVNLLVPEIGNLISQLGQADPEEQFETAKQVMPKLQFFFGEFVFSLKGFGIGM